MLHNGTISQIDARTVVLHDVVSCETSISEQQSVGSLSSRTVQFLGRYSICYIHYIDSLVYLKLMNIN
jgi:hypothetical protein